MLGTLGGDLTFSLVAALADGDGARLLAEVDHISTLTPDFGQLLRELIGLLHRLALFQQVPQTVPADDPERARIADLAGRMTPEDLQLFYQVALSGQPDLALAPDPRTGLEMVLLRALAFRPADGNAGIARPAATPSAGDAVPTPVAPPASATRRRVTAPAAEGPAPAPVPLTSTADWHHLVDRLGVGGMASQLAHHCGFVAWDTGRLCLSLDPTAEQLRSTGTEERLRNALETALGPLRLEIRVVRPSEETPAQRREREYEERLLAARATLAADPPARRLRDQFDGQWVPGSIEPVG